jgi:hypothetical protein
MKLLFFNSQGQFCSTDQNLGFFIETEYYSMTSKRNGQVAPEKGNDIQVVSVIKCIKDVPSFIDPLFGVNYYYSMRSAGGDCSKHFSSTKWRDAFKSALDYYLSEVYKLELLIEARDRVLVSAEF